MFGVSLSFAVKRWPEPSEWTKFLVEELDIKDAQFTFDLIDPFWDKTRRSQMVNDAKKCCKNHGISIHSAFAGLAYYTFNGLMNQDAGARESSKQWWYSAVELSSELETPIIGGPLGGMTVSVSKNKALSENLYQEQIEFIFSLCEHAKKMGLKTIMFEPTPLKREFPHSVEQALTMAEELRNTAIPVRFLVDIGHALYQPLYGEKANMIDWLEKLKNHIGAIHLQNTDFQSDSHWGWPHKNGNFDVSDFFKLLESQQLSHLPMFLEVFYPFELSDEEVIANIKSSVAYCKSALQTS